MHRTRCVRRIVVAALMLGLFAVTAARSEAAAPQAPRVALDQCQEAAAKGDPAAQFRLGEMLLKGNAAPKDATRAFAWFQKAADQRYPLACVRVAEALAQGEGVEKNPARAAERFDQAVSAFRRFGWEGHPAARYTTSQAFDEDPGAGNDRIADAWWMMAEAYVNGLDVAKDRQEAEPWFQKAAARYRSAAEKGNRLACLRMGEACRYGKGEPQSEEKAKAWEKKAFQGYRQAAEAGDVRAQYVLASLFQCGLGVEPDLPEGTRWYIKAGSQGYVRAYDRLGFVFGIDTLVKFGEPLDKGAVRQQIQQHIHWLRKAAELGSPVGCCHMHEAYSAGEGGVVEKDSKAAVAWLLKALDCTDPEYSMDVQRAERALARSYDRGLDTPKDPARAKELWGRYLSKLRRQTDWGDSGAMLELGRMYLNGEGVAADRKQAVAWLEKAAKAGNGDAKKELARLTAKAIPSPQFPDDPVPDARPK